MMITRLRAIFRILVTVSLVAAGGLLIWLSTQPYPVVRPFLDSFFDQKGFETLNQINFPVFVWIFRITGLGLCILTAITLFYRQRAWNEFRAFIKNLSSDFVGFVKYLKPGKIQPGILSLVILILVFGFVLRLIDINRPLEYDEAYTYVAFASGSFQTTISDYHLPNNHVFHSILVYLSTHVFGMEPWAVRLPVFIASLFIILVVYWLAARMYNRRAGLVGAALTAYVPVSIFYGTNARGYTILALIWLLVLLLGMYLLEHKNRFAWGLLTLLSAVGFYTLPVMLFPYGALIIWLSLSRLVDRSPGAYRSRLEFFIYLILSAVGAAFLSLFFYLPIFLRSGFRLVFENSFVIPLTWNDFWPTLMSRMEALWSQWTNGMPAFLVWLLVFGFLIGVIIDRRISRLKFPLQIAVLLSFVAIFIVRHPETPVRIYSFLIPTVLIWASAGIIGVTDVVSQFLLKGKQLSVLVTGIALLFLILNTILALPTFSQKWSAKGQVESVALYLKDNLQDRDLFVVAVPDDAPLWYYALLHGVSFNHFMRELGYTRVLVIVSLEYDQTLESVIQERGPSRESLSCKTYAPLVTIGSTQIFECWPR